MILEQETFEAFGYYPSELKPHSNKRILAACDGCGKIRELCRGDYRALCMPCSRKGEKNPFYGKHHSEETKKKIRENHADNSGDKHPMFGKHHSEEARRKNSEAKCGNKNPNYGKPRSEETRRKISESEKGKKVSEETKKKMRDASKKRFAKEEERERMREMRKNQTTYHTKPEMIWQEIAIDKHLLPFKYTGDGSFWIGGSPAINPDFIHLTKKIVVEIFSYWHDPLRRNGKVRYSATLGGRKKILKKRGWELIVFWQEDLEREDAEVFVLSELRKEGVIK